MLEESYPRNIQKFQSTSRPPHLPTQATLRTTVVEAMGIPNASWKRQNRSNVNLWLKHFLGVDIFWTLGWFWRLSMPFSLAAPHLHFGQRIQASAWATDHPCARTLPGSTQTLRLIVCGCQRSSKQQQHQSGECGHLKPRRYRALEPNCVRPCSVSNSCRTLMIIYFSPP